MVRFRKTSERAKSQPGRGKGAHERRVQEASAMPRTLWGGWGLEYSSKSNSFPGSLLTLGAKSTFPNRLRSGYEIKVAPE